MPCDTNANLTWAQKERMASALARLDSALAAGIASLVIGPTGAIAFKGFAEREGLTDVCAYRRLLSSNSPALRRAVARAETLSGRKIDPRAIAAGVHSHDGGTTWGAH